METALIVSVTLFFVVVVAYIIYVIVGGFKPKSTQFTMRNPPKPPQTLEEKYFDLKIEAIRLMNEFRIVDLKIKEIERQLKKNTNEKNTEKL